MSALIKTCFKISKMDCPSEERIIRMKLADHAQINSLDFNIPQREMTVVHGGPAQDVLEALIPLNFGASILTSGPTESDGAAAVDPQVESRLLIKLMAINGAMFLVELIAGLTAESMGLISDSLDMLADAGVYGISLFAVGKALSAKKLSVKVNGTFQIILALGIIAETLRRFFYGSDPEPSYMIVVSLIALAANVYCLVLLSGHKHGEVHMKASYICSSTDVMANLGVVLAGILVFFTRSPYPDLAIGMIVTVIVLRGAFSILSLAK